VAALLASAGQAASPEQAQTVHVETGGNPFLVRELARMRAEQPGAAPGTVPGTVLDVTSYRIAQLVPASQDVLRAAAVAGNSFSVGVVAQMLGTAVLALLDPVDECQAAGFLVAGDRPGDYRFSHALVRSAVVARELADLAICVGRMQAPVARWHMLQYSATHAYATGRYAAALRLAGEAFQVMTDMGHPSAFGGYGAVMSPIAMHIGFEASGVTEFLAQIPPHFLPGGSDADAPVASMLPTVNLALMWLERGDRDQAARMYELVRPVRSWHAIPSLRLIAWAQGLAAAIGLARTDDIAYLAEQFEPLRGRHVASGAGAGSYLGPVELHLGKAAAALGALEAAIGDLETAAGICEQIGEPGFAVEARVELAAALARRGAGADTDRARTLLAAAAPDAQRLGMAPFSQRIEGLRARLPTGTPPLSPREREVARLVEQGLTNRQIAAALYVSERTAQNHVQHILDKLGFANRSQIAVWSSASPAPPAE